MTTPPTVRAFFQPSTWTLTYVVYDASTGDALLVDPALDYEPRASVLSFEALDEVLDFVGEQKLNLHAVVDTHVHADHLTAMHEVKKRLQIPSLISERVIGVQEVFGDLFKFAPDRMARDGSQFDQLIRDKQPMQFGSLALTALPTPGHTPACQSLMIGDAVFTGDTLFMPDSGTGRCDFPKGSAADLYDGIQNELYTLDDATRVFVGHDYQPHGRELQYETTIGAQKQNNTMLPADISKDDFVQKREARDATLAAPNLLFQSVQYNVNAGVLPDPGGFLRIPLRIKDGE